MVELWMALLLYGGGWINDLKLLAARGVRKIFDWEAIPHPTTFGRWLRRAAPVLVPVLDRLVWKLVRVRWKEAGVPEELTLGLDSTVRVRYGEDQAGAERGYNPKKPGRPSHHPLLAFAIETGDCLGIRWRDGSAWAGEGAVEWLPLLVDRLREAGVQRITVRLDKGFFDQDILECLQELEVSYLLKVPNHPFVRDQLREWRRNERADPIFEEADRVYSSTGSLWGARLVSLEGRRSLQDRDGTLDLDTYEITETAHILTDQDRIHALTAWRAYNQGARIEARIKEIRQWLIRMPAKYTRHARKRYLQLQRDEPLRLRFLKALRRLASWDPPPLAACS